MNESFESAQLLLDGAKEDIEEFSVAEEECVKDLGAKPKADSHFKFATRPKDLKPKLGKIAPTFRPLFKSLQPYPSGNGYEGADAALRMLGTIADPNQLARGLW